MHSCYSCVCTEEMEMGGGSCLGSVPTLGAGPGHEACEPYSCPCIIYSVGSSQNDFFFFFFTADHVTFLV